MQFNIALYVGNLLLPYQFIKAELCLYQGAIFFAQMTILAEWRRNFERLSWFNNVVNAARVITATAFVTFLSAYISPGKYTVVLRLSSIVNIVTEGVVTIMPILVVVMLHARRKDRFHLTLLFGIVSSW